MPPLDEYAVSHHDLSSGIVVLKKRQRNLSLLAILSSSILIASVVGLFLQQDLVYGFFGLNTEVQQLHVPASLDEQFTYGGNSPDYFLSLLSWFGWLILKIFASFIGAFVAISLLKKLRYFYERFQSFVLKFVGWLIAFIVIWSGLTYWQHDLNDHQDNAYQALVYYDHHIHDSEIAQSLADANVTVPVKSYLLAQTALLHQPADLATAKPYVAALVEAEQKDAKFERYGFKAEQIWVMQQQVYAKTLTPIAESVKTQVQKANQLSDLVKLFLMGLIVVSIILSVIFYVLARSIQARTVRIEHRILD